MKTRNVQLGLFVTLVMLVLNLLTFSTAAFGQSVNTSVEGAVKDSTGALVPDIGVYRGRGGSWL